VTGTVAETEVDALARGPGAHYLRKTEVSYKLRFADLYWTYQSSTIGLIGTTIFVVLGLILFSSLISSAPGTPVAQDVEVGVLFFVLAPVLVPAVLIWAIQSVNSSARRGFHVDLVFTSEGVDGWALPLFRDTTWPKLRHPRMESRVLVLPFSWPSADSWVIVPARAFTPDQLDEVLAILRAHGYFVDGDHRSLMGRLMSLLLDRGPALEVGHDQHLERFPRLSELAAQSGSNGSR
jgi:hypothetical protein